MKKIFVTGLLLVLAPFTAHANAIADGYHNVNACMIIENTHTFSDYQFYLVGNEGQPFVLPITGDEICNLSGFAKIVAVANEDVEHVNLSAVDWPNHAASQPYLVWSQDTFHFTEQVKDVNQTKTERQVVRVNYVTQHVESELRYTQRIDESNNVIAEKTNPSLGTIALITSVAGLAGLLIARMQWKR